MKIAFIGVYANNSSTMVYGGEILSFSKFYEANYMASSEAMTSSTHFAYSYRLVKKMFCEIMRNFKMS